MTTRLMLICHASTEATRSVRFPADEPLDDQGRGRALVLANHLRAADRVWVSPELRARQTAEALGLGAVVVPELRDCDYGMWRGCSFEELSARDPETISTWLRDPSAAPHGGESTTNLIQRVARWLDQQRQMPSRAIVVTHAVIIRAAIVHAIDASAQTFWRIDVSPLSQTCLSGHDGRWNLRYFGPIRPSVAKQHSSYGSQTRPFASPASNQ
jgi:broad specificity phosphatase PhoE